MNRPGVNLGIMLENALLPHFPNRTPISVQWNHEAGLDSFVVTVDGRGLGSMQTKRGVFGICIMTCAVLSRYRAVMKKEDALCHAD